MRSPGYSTRRRLPAMVAGATFWMAFWVAATAALPAAAGEKPGQNGRSTDPDRIETSGVEFRPVASLEDLNRELAAAAAKDTIVLLNVYADWCLVCIEMQETTFRRTAVVRTLSSAVVLQADVSAYDNDHKALLEHFGLLGPPALLFFDREGQALEDLTVLGYANAARLVEHARDALAL